MELLLFVEHQCNLRCTYCYNGEKYSRRMDGDTARAAIDFALSMHPETLDLSFFGGEPLLRFDLIREATDYARKAIAKTNNANSKGVHPSLRVILNTNGTMWTEEILGWLAEQPNATAIISLDGPRDVHDAHRKTVSGSGTFGVIVDGLTELQRRNIDYYLVAVINADTAHRAGDVVRTLRPLGAQRNHLAMNLRDAWTPDTVERLREGLRDAADVWQQTFREGQPMSLEPFQTKILSHLHGGMPCPSRCLIAGKELAVAPSGRIYPCGQMVGEDRDHTLVIGHLSTGLDHGRIRAMQAEKDRVEQVCGDCALRDRCQSHCGCRHIALSGRLGEITAVLCETESAVIEEADRVAEALFSEKCPSFIEFFYQREWRPTAGSRLTQLRTHRAPT